MLEHANLKQSVTHKDDECHPQLRNAHVMDVGLKMWSCTLG